MTGRFELYKDDAGKFRFRLKASNGDTLASSAAYENKASAVNGLDLVRRNAPEARLIDHTQQDAPAVEPEPAVTVDSVKTAYQAAVRLLGAVEAAHGISLTELRRGIVDLRNQAIQAVLHDRQPYPTADAYERACVALDGHRRRADAAERAVGAVGATAREWAARCAPGEWAFDMPSTVFADAGRSILALLDGIETPLVSEAPGRRGDPAVLEGPDTSGTSAEVHRG